MPRLWPFPVRHPVTEVLEWNTDTMITEAAEQRIALRTVPRSILTFMHLLDATGLTRAAELARAGLVDTWTVPLWHMARPAASAVDAADLTVFVDTDEGVLRRRTTFAPSTLERGLKTLPFQKCSWVLRDRRRLCLRSKGPACGGMAALGFLCRKDCGSLISVTNETEAGQAHILHLSRLAGDAR